MKKLLQIDSCLGVRSTGRIAEEIGVVAKSHGWDCYIVHGARYVGKSQMKSIQASSRISEYIHYAQGLLFDNHGLVSVYNTKVLLKQIDLIKPNVIQMHCIHGYYLNYKLLFEYVIRNNIPIVWTFHDCWAFTGHCAYFDSINCKKWKIECHDCELKESYPKSLFADKSKRNYYLKRNLFTSVQNMTIIPVSYWLEDLVKQSFFYSCKIVTIHNGLDINVFKPCNKIGIINGQNVMGKTVVLGVAAPWSKRKGMADFIALTRILDDNFIIVLVGLNEQQLQNIPSNVIGIKRTNSVTELAQLYSEADIFVNPTYSDNFPTTNIEALACGIPVITYNTGGSPEAVDEKTGVVVPQGDVNALAEAIIQMRVNPFSSADCRQRALDNYDKDKCFEKYLNLYESYLI